MQEVKTNKNKQMKVLLLSVSLALFLGFLFSPSITRGQSLFNPFGGKVSVVIPCTCSSGYQVTIVSPFKYSGTYLYSPGILTKVYKNYFVYPSVWVLGKYISGGTCLITNPPPATGCSTLPILRGTMTMVGVSF